jgi:hypothetical protein
MHAENLAPADPVPTSVEMLDPTPAPPGGNANTLELLPLALLLDVVVVRLATDGDFDLPPHPAAASTRPVSAARHNRRRVLEII